jgi:hypothetical protein
MVDAAVNLAWLYLIGSAVVGLGLAINSLGIAYYDWKERQALKEDV